MASERRANAPRRTSKLTVFRKPNSDAMEIRPVSTHFKLFRILVLQVSVSNINANEPVETRVATGGRGCAAGLRFASWHSETDVRPGVDRCQNTCSRTAVAHCCFAARTD